MSLADAKPEFEGRGRQARSARQWRADERALFARAEEALTHGRQLLRWWRDTERRDAYQERFEVVSTYHRPDRSFAFFDLARVAGQEVKVMGDVENLFYDRPKRSGDAAAAEWTRRQVREFVLRYFLRVSDFRAPSASTLYRPPELALPFRPLSWCPDGVAREEGFGYSQLYYKRAGSGGYGAFGEADRHRIVDLRRVGPELEWLLMRVSIFSFDLEARPFGPGTPRLEVPLAERQLVVLSRDFLCDEDHPEPGVLGRYGFGYAVLPGTAGDGVLAYGPGHFEVGFQTFTFEVMETGEVRLHLVFTVNRPERLVRISADPRRWLGVAGRWLGLLEDRDGGRDGGEEDRFAFDPVLGTVRALNFLTDGQVARDFCISRRQLERDMLVQHFLQNYQMIVGSLLTWRQIPDWLDTAALPSWVVRGNGA